MTFIIIKDKMIGRIVRRGMSTLGVNGRLVGGNYEFCLPGVEGPPVSLKEGDNFLDLEAAIA